MAIEINSDSMIAIDHHFKVSAGPGAGKTHWLAMHVSHVLKVSERLGKIGKVACLSYTNVGADTLMGRMCEKRNRILSCTLHSFLYTYIVKPYLHFIADEEGFNMGLLTGEDDRILSDYNTIETILKSVNQHYGEHDMVVSAIRSAKWKLKENGSLVCVAFPKKKCSKKGYFLKEEAYSVYKKLAWEKGYMHYDDVLYFSYKLIQKFPFIIKTIATQFPYIFIDEFQDTNPIQAKIIRLLGENDTVIGVIGDYAQSIYGFLGADPKQFETFSLNGIQNYTIKDNRRSCIEVVNLLNIVRPEFQQTAIRNEHGMIPLLLVGELMDCYNEAQKIAAEEVHALSYRNIEANILKQEFDAHVCNGGLLNQIVDCNYERKEFVVTWIKVIEHARNKQFSTSFKMLESIGIRDLDAYTSLKEAIENYNDYCNNSLRNLYDYLYDHWNISKMRQGTKTFEFYSTHTYRQLAQCVGLQEDKSAQRTVHKSKGDEFNNVFVIFTDEKALNNVLLNPKIRNNESDRVYYVAMSRARDRLFLTIPALSKRVEKSLEKLPIEIRYI